MRCMPCDGVHNYILSATVIRPNLFSHVLYYKKPLGFL
jgi:hypothetical protein